MRRVGAGTSASAWTSLSTGLSCLKNPAEKHSHSTEIVLKSTIIEPVLLSSDEGKSTAQSRNSELAFQLGNEFRILGIPRKNFEAEF
jgi:hypothetical protein